MSGPIVSVVVITKDERPRLELVLESLWAQETTVPWEIVVVDDGSTDGTGELLDRHASNATVRCVRHARCRGRSAARNAGAAAAAGTVLVFLDGDTVADRHVVERHARVHAEAAGPVVGRGETHHLRCTRFFHDPQRGIPAAGQEDRVARMADRLEQCLVTRSQVAERFEEVARRGAPGIYPGGGPRRLYELEMEALSEQPDSPVLWMAVAAQNLSVGRREFRETGGFDAEITLNEHRELALRLCERGCRIVPVVGARTYHLTHRVGWRDPVADDTTWERQFYRAHPIPAVKLMSVLWQSLAGDPHIPEGMRITSFRQLAAIVEQGASAEYDELRRAHPGLADLA